jgi:signal transduction histidine kinase
LLPDDTGNKAALPLLPISVKLVAVIAIGAILGLSFLIYFVLQTGSEHSIRSAIFEQQKQREIQYARSLSLNIQSDLDLLMNSLRTVAGSRAVQAGEFDGASANKALQLLYDQAGGITDINGIYILDKNNKVVNFIDPAADRSTFMGYDTSKLPTVIEYRENLPNPTFSTAYKSVVTNALQLAIYYPIYSDDSGDYLGAVSMSLDVEPFFRQYGNIDDLTDQYLAALDSKATILITPFKDIIGLNVYDDYVRSLTSEANYAHYEAAMSGRESVGVFDFRTGERLTVGEPIILNGKLIYSIFVVTPTASIYAQVDPVLAADRLETYSLLAAVAGAIAVALFFLIRWSGTLEKGVKERTRALQKANEQLEAHDKMQQEFINVAAHELRTPIQPILGLAEMWGVNITEPADDADEVRIKKSDLRVIGRNATRLERLSSDILDVSRIQSGSLKLRPQKFDINELAKEAIDDARKHRDLESVRIICKASNQEINIVADKPRIMQVITNLLNNAIRFTRPVGTVIVTINREEEEVKVVVTDSGEGIDQAMIPKLFTKFSSTSRAGSGTGLGLFISKAIIEAHGGRIWGKNNSDGKGATFGFVMPTILKDIGMQTIANQIVDGNKNPVLSTLAKEAFETS